MCVVAKTDYKKPFLRARFFLSRTHTNIFSIDMRLEWAEQKRKNKSKWKIECEQIPTKTEGVNRIKVYRIN